MPLPVSTADPTTALPRKTAWKQSAVGLALVASFLYFVVRGPLRAIHSGSDFRHYFFIALRTFARGGDPYRLDQLLATAGDVSPVHRQVLQYANNAVIVYPPPFFVMAPLGLLPVDPARWLWLATQCIAFAALLWCASRFVSGDWSSLQKRLFVAGGLCLAPIHTGLSSGSTGPLFASLTVVFLLCLRNGWTAAAGLILGALMIKPTFGIPAAALALILAEWRVVALGSAAGSAASLPMFWRLGVRESLTEFLHSVALQAAPGMPADETRWNPQHYQLVNLRSWANSLLEPVWADTLTMIALGLLIYALFQFRRQAGPNGPAFYWTLAACFICLAGYHRFYDAAVVALPLATAFDLYQRRSRWTWVWAAALAPFAVPGATFLHLKLGPLAHAPLIEPFLIRHDTLALMMLAACSLIGLSRRAAAAEALS